jgi:hypothetical protein
MKIVLIAIVATLLFAGLAQAATPPVATKRISACLKRGGATEVKLANPRHRTGAGGTAYYGRPRREHYLRWSYLTVSDDRQRWDTGRVVGVVETWDGLSHAQRRAATRCMAPFNR